jgi:hypothetical protein
LFGRLPELQDELDRLLNQLNDDISRLPSPPTDEPEVEMMKLIGDFVRSIDHSVAGTPDGDGLIQALRRPREQFKREIRQTAPDFRPLEKGFNPAPVLPEPRFLSSEEDESEWQPTDANRAIFVDEVMNRANSLVNAFSLVMPIHDPHPVSAVTRELPNNFPYIVKKQYIGTIVKLWDRPSRKFFDSARNELNKHIKLQIEEHFLQYTHGQLKQRVMYASRFLPVNVPFVYNSSGT